MQRLSRVGGVKKTSPVDVGPPLNETPDDKRKRVRKEKLQADREAKVQAMIAKQERINEAKENYVMGCEDKDKGVGALARLFIEYFSIRDPAKRKLPGFKQVLPKEALDLFSWYSSKQQRSTLLNNNALAALFQVLVETPGLAANLFPNKKLELSNSKLKHSGLNRLGLFLKNNIVKLDVSGNKLGAKGAELIAASVKDSNTLVVMNISKNDIKQDGAAKIAEAIKDHSALSHLNISGNDIGTSGARSLASVLRLHPVCTNGTPYEPGVTVGSKVALNRDVDDDLMEGTVGEMASEEADEDGQYRVIFPSGEGSFPLDELRDAVSGNMMEERCNHCQKAMKHHEQRSALRRVDCSNNGSMIHGAWNDKTKGYSKDVFGLIDLCDAIKANEVLAEICFSGNDLGGLGGGDTGWYFNPDFEVYEPGEYQFKHTDGRLQEEEPPDLPQLNIAGISVLANAVKMNKGLLKIDVSHDFLLGEGVSLLAEAVTVHPTLQTLILADTQMLDGHAGDVLSAMLIANTTLTTLDLSDNTNNQTTKESAIQFLEPLCVGLNSNQTVSTLRLAGNSFATRKAGKLIGTLLSDNTVLTALDVSGNYNDVAESKYGTSFIEECLIGIQGNVTLKSLNLARNGAATRKAGCAINEMLATNDTLTALDVSGNWTWGRAEDGLSLCQQICEGLASNRSIAELNISSNCIGGYWDDLERDPDAPPDDPLIAMMDKGGGPAKQKLRQDHSKPVTANGVTNEGSMYLAQVLHSSSSLTKVDVSDNNLTPKAQKMLKLGLRIKLVV
jgi:Ran GTPase-activating protein (RanGAP) involved in mRNA processing and transport